MKKENDVELQRVYEKALTVFGKPVRVKKLMLIGIVGVVIGTYGYLEVGLTGWLIFAFLNLILLVFSAILNYKTILYFGEKSIELSPSGDIYITILHGHCSKCDGHLKIVKTKKSSYIKCDKDPTHIWNLFENFEEEKEKKD